MMKMMMRGVRLLPQKCLRLAYVATSPFCPPSPPSPPLPLCSVPLWLPDLEIGINAAGTILHLVLHIFSARHSSWYLISANMNIETCHRILRTVQDSDHVLCVCFFLILCLRLCLWSCLCVVFCVIWSEAYCRQAVQDKRCWWVSEWTGPVSGLHQHQQELLLFASAWKYYLHQHQQELLLIAAVSGTTTISHQHGNTICISINRND